MSLEQPYQTPAITQPIRRIVTGTPSDIAQREDFSATKC